MPTSLPQLVGTALFQRQRTDRFNDGYLDQTKNDAIAQLHLSFGDRTRLQRTGLRSAYEGMKFIVGDMHLLGSYCVRQL